MEMERPRREDWQQQMDTQAHHVGPQRRQKESGTTTDEKDWPTQKIAGDQWSRSAKDRVLWKELEKNFNSIGLSQL